jgi:hypothetical protein
MLHHALRRLTLVGSLALPLIVLEPRSAAAAEVCDSLGVCVAGAQWSGGEQLDDKARAREAKKNRGRKASTLTVELVDRRGSVFIDGVWIALAPLNYVPIAPGKHDVEIRDGERVLARGVLTVGTRGGDVTIRVGDPE